MNMFADLAEGDRAAAWDHLQEARAYVEAAAEEALARFDEHLHVSLLLTQGYWAALCGDDAAHRSSTNAAIALADADGRPFPRAVARTMSAVSATYVRDTDLAHALSTQALDLDERFGFGWLKTLAASVYDWAAGSGGDDTADATASIEETLDEMVAAGHRGTQSTILLMLADVHRLAGRTDEARSALLQARESPGPYRGLFVDLVDRRLGELG